jgi:hypothetical protein
MNPSPTPDYNVPISGAIRELLIRLHDRAASDGQRDEFLSALRDISTKLKTEPVTFGEPLYDLHSLRLTVRLAVILPLSVEFAVYSDRRLVFIRDFRYIPPG